MTLYIAAILIETLFIGIVTKYLTLLTFSSHNCNFISHIVHLFLKFSTLLVIIVIFFISQLELYFLF